MTHAHVSGNEAKVVLKVTASVAGHTFVNTLAPLLPATHRILLIDASEISYFPIAALRAAVKPGEFVVYIIMTRSL